MPLHLLGKKSWNVYNTENVERVKRDEAAAAAREAEEEQRMQEIDAECRIELLRGQRPSNHSETSVQTRARSTSPPRKHEHSGSRRSQKRIPGESDTDRDLRLAIEVQADKTIVPQKSKSSNAPLVGEDGHISLFPSEGGKKESRNAERASEEKEKQKELEDQYVVWLSNARGYRTDIRDIPWYVSDRQKSTMQNDGPIPQRTVTSDDSRLQEKRQQRTALDDPLASMKRGIADTRQTNRERRRWKEEKRREVEELLSTDKDERRRRRARHTRHRRSVSHDKDQRDHRKSSHSANASTPRTSQAS